MHATWIPAGIPTHNITLFYLLLDLSPSVLPGPQRCWPRAPDEFRGIGVEVNVTASLGARHAKKRSHSLTREEAVTFTSTAIPLNSAGARGQHRCATDKIRGLRSNKRESRVMRCVTRKEAVTFTSTPEPLNSARARGQHRCAPGKIGGHRANKRDGRVILCVGIPAGIHIVCMPTYQ